MGWGFLLRYFLLLALVCASAFGQMPTPANQLRQAAGGGGSVTFTYVNNCTADTAGAQNLPCVFSGGVTASNLMVCAFTFGDGTNLLSTVTDTQTNTWAAVPTATTGTNGFCADTGNGQSFYLWYAIAGSTAANTVTAAFSTSRNNTAIACVEFSSNQPTIAIDASDGAFDATGSSGTDGDQTPSVTTTVNGDLLIGAFMGTSTGATTWTAGGSPIAFTSRASVTAGGGSGPFIESATQTTAAAGTAATVTASDTSQYCGMLGTFKGTP